MLLNDRCGEHHTVLGVFRGEELIANWRLRRRASRPWIIRSPDADLFTLEAGPRRDYRSDYQLGGAAGELDAGGNVARIFWAEGDVRRAGGENGNAVLVDNPSEVGADRIVNGVARFTNMAGRASWWILGRDYVRCDLAKGEYLGGVIGGTGDFVGSAVRPRSAASAGEIKDLEK